MSITPAELAWRDFVVDGVSGSGFKEPDKADARGFGKAVQLTNTISPAALTADVDDYAPPGGADANIWRLTTNGGNYRVRGWVGGSQGRFVILYNANAPLGGTISVGAECTTTAAGNRMTAPAGIGLRPGEGRRFNYDGTINRWVPEGLVTAPGAWQSYKNLLIVNNAVAPNSIMDASADELILEDADGNTVRLRNFAQSPSMAVSGAGGLDTGAEASGTWYAIWGGYNPATGATTAYFSTSATAPTKPTGYTFAMRIGWIYNDGSSNFMRIRQVGRVACYKVTAATNTAVIPNIASGVAGTMNTTSPVLAAASVATVVPPTAAEIIVAAFSKWKNGAAGSVLVAPNTDWGGTNNGPIGSAGQVWPIYIDSTLVTMSVTARLALEGSTIAWAGGAAGSAISCVGWVDNF